MKVQSNLFNVVALGVVLCMTTICFAVPLETAFTYQGLLDDGGSPADALYDFQFKLFDALSGGSQEGGDVLLGNVDVDGGHFTVQLDFGAGVFDGQERWLEIGIRPGELEDPNAYTLLDPRQKITPAPYALHAKSAEPDDDWMVSGDDISAIPSGNVGIGTASPEHLLHVVGNSNPSHTIFGHNINSVGTTAGVYGMTNSPSGVGVKGYAATSANGQSIGVHGSSNSSGGRGVMGLAGGGAGGAGFTVGVYGQTTSTGGAGTYGYASNNYGNSKAIMGTCVSTSGWAGYFEGRGYFSKNAGFGIVSPSYPVHAYSPGSFAIYGQGETGVYGTSIRTDGRGVVGYTSSNTGLNYGVYGHSNGDEGIGVFGFTNHSTGLTKAINGKCMSPNGYAGYFEGQGTAIYAEGQTGVYGISTDSIGRGLFGFGASLTGVNYGVYGLSASNTGAGVYGYNANTTGTTRGVYGQVDSDTGSGVYGYATGSDAFGGAFYASGINGIGIRATGGANGYAAVFNGTTKTEVLEITGADLAEKFPVSEEVKPGMVVAIDPDSPGKLCLARGAYNRCVAGVVSGANDLSVGVVLGNLPGNEKAPPIALSGRVWVYCDAGTEPIEPGDLLTTSNSPGHAMKVTDREKAYGTVIGKAMTRLSQRRGLVLVLVNLQ